MPLSLISNFAAKQAGGAKGGMGFFGVFLISLLVLFIKIFLVFWTYNQTVPTLFTQRYRKITMLEALYLVILVQSLFN